MKSGSDPDSFELMLKSCGLKTTKQRLALLELVSESEEPLSAEDLYISLKEKNISVNLSTVYRALESLAEKGLFSKITLAGDNRSLFEFNRIIHRHYLVCVNCRKIRPIEHCPLEEYEKSLAAQTGYEILSHKLAVYGRCPECTQKGDYDGAEN